MSTLTSSPAATTATGTTRGLRLSGLNWLVWRQHRAGFWTILAATALCTVWIVYQRAQMTDYLNGIGWPHPKDENWSQDFHKYSSRLTSASYGLGLIPVLLGVFLGAPLLASDLENGTAKLVTSQSVSRVRWLTTKLGITALVVTVSTVALSLLFAWWWEPVKKENSVIDWTSGSAFDVTGPVPVALTLFTVIGGVAIGMLLRRTLVAMVVTFGFATLVQVVWGYFRMDLGNTITVTTHHGVADSSFPKLPDAAYQVDQWFITGSGKLLSWSTCADEQTDKARQACLHSKDVVGWSVDYLPLSQMSSMQWLGAGILLALTAGVTAFIFVWGRKRLV
ncbi:ABC transporter permease subunit [Wenjunlia tyrosinilytica]|uniref:Transporter n=1 Tax=Wenjunlia tyrosinilytica TaxID=1544741 RepID=A0A918DZK4_9ACTN|nr:ABC transporter permease subunit [Wenjunlia tyrosinilytica]GGO95715.1 transporter [Wenjunlia tyrosinilytica]